MRLHLGEYIEAQNYVLSPCFGMRSTVVSTKRHRIMIRSTVYQAGVDIEFRSGSEGEDEKNLQRACSGGEMERGKNTNTLNLLLPPPDPGVQPIRGVDNCSQSICLLDCCEEVCNTIHLRRGKETNNSANSRQAYRDILEARY